MPRLYTVPEADATLPLVRRIVEDAVAAYGRWRALVDEFEVVSARSRADLPDPRAAVLQREAQGLAREIDGFVLELRTLDVELKDVGLGLVDFPATIDGRPAWLCWRLGERAVRHWHERDAGMAGRRPIDAQGRHAA